MKRKKHRKIFGIVLFLLFLVSISLFLINKFAINDNYEDINTTTKNISKTTITTTKKLYNIENIPEYDGSEYIIINNNEPTFSDEYKNQSSFELYSNLDSLGRCGVAFANIGVDLMPTEERSSISSVKPSGWNQKKYDIIKGKYLYNRCHLIGFQLAGEQANEKNLITCTKQANTGAMLEYENKVANYVKTTNNHVLYRITPIFYEDNLLASGIQMEGLSVEDDGLGIKFNIYVYNVQNGININYLTGESSLAN